MLSIKVGESNSIATNLFLSFLLHLIALTSNKKLFIRGHEIFDKNPILIADNKTSSTSSTSYLTDDLDRPSIANYTDLSVKKSDREERQRETYSNHRMVLDNVDESSNKSNTNRLDLDGAALDSILRPQLAVQIYTNSLDENNHLDDADSTGSQSRQSNIGTKFNNARIIVPISQQQPNQFNHRQYHDNSRNIQAEESLATNHKTSNPWHYFTEQTPNQSNNSNDYNNPDPSDDVYNHQHYGTNETPTINAIITVPHSSQSSNSQTIINKQNSNRHQRRHQHDSIKQQNSDKNTSSSIISQILDDQVNGNIEISMNLNGDEIIIDPVSKFGRVVSINSSRETDDEEIKQKHRAGDNGISNNNGGNNYEPTTGQQKYSTSGSTKQDKGSRSLQQGRLMDKTVAGISKALKKHISIDLAGGDQQSASEIDQINNNNNNNSNGYYSDGNNSEDDNLDNDNNNSKNLDNNDMDFIRTSTTTTSVNDNRDDQDIETNSKPKLKDINDEIERDERSSGSRNDRFWSDDSNSPPDKDTKVRDVQTTDESSHDDRLSNNAYYQQNNQRAINSQHLIDKKIDTDTSGINRKQIKPRFNKPLSRQQSVLISDGNSVSGGAISSRKTSSSKRRPTYKSDEKDNSGTDIDRYNIEREDERRIIDNNQNSNGKVSPVIIKGEDVRKFEQLLENLRSLSLNNLAISKSKTRTTNKVGNSNKGTPSSAQENSGIRSSYYEDSDGQNNRNDSDDQLASQDAQAKSWNNNEHDHDDNRQSTNSQAKKKEVSLIDSECDRRNRRQQLMQKSASGDEPAFEPDSSPNIVDQDPITSSDGNDDLNDEGSQNIEREEHTGADQYNKLSSLDRQQATNNDHDQNLKEDRNSASNSEQLDKPKTLFIRKTILQNYYDHMNGDDYRSGSIPNKSNDDFDSIHRSHHEARHQETLGNENDLNNRQNVRRSVVDVNGESSRVVGNYGHQQQEFSNPSLTIDDTSSPGSTNYIDYNQLDDRTINREAGIVSRDKMPSREQIDHMKNLQHLIERAAIRSSQSEKFTLNLVS